LVKSDEKGILRRRHILVDTIEDIGKESDGWEEDDARTEDQDTVLIYPSSSFDRERMSGRIKSVGKRELMREARIAMRKVDAALEGQEVDDEDLKRMADAAERIVSRKKRRDDEQAVAIAWLKTKLKEVGLTALAKMLGVDVANLGKVIEGRGNLQWRCDQKLPSYAPRVSKARFDQCPKSTLRSRRRALRSCGVGLGKFTLPLSISAEI
jgi:hypothetical protein